jgi:hypothetical protein
MHMLSQDFKSTLSALFCLLLFSTCSERTENPTSIMFYGEVVYLQTNYYWNNRIRALKTFVDSEKTIPHGFEKWYHQNGKLQYLAHFDQGMQIGSSYHFSPSGKLIGYGFDTPQGQLIFNMETSNEIDELERRRCSFVVVDKNSKTHRVYSVDIPGFEKTIHLLSGSNAFDDRLVNRDYLFSEFDYEGLSDSVWIVIRYTSKDTILIDSMLTYFPADQ